jgi:hypothetical protein
MSLLFARPPDPALTNVQRLCLVWRERFLSKSEEDLAEVNYFGGKDIGYRFQNFGFIDWYGSTCVGAVTVITEYKFAVIKSTISSEKQRAFRGYGTDRKALRSIHVHYFGLIVSILFAPISF